MGVHIPAQRHENCSDQGFKFFVMGSTAN